MEERIKSRFRKDLLFPVLYGLGGIIFLFYMPHADEFGFWASLIFAALLLLMSALFTWLAWITRQKSLQSYQKLYSHYPELEKKFSRFIASLAIHVKNYLFIFIRMQSYEMIAIFSFLCFLI